MSFDINILFMIVIPFLFVALFMPVIKKVAVYINAIDYPNQRKVHKVPIPRLGGLGIYSGFLLGYMLFGYESVQMNSILIGSIIIIMIGIVDDIHSIPARYKFIGQLVAAGIVTLYGGILLKDISFFGVYINFGVFSKFFTILFITAIMNCINFIDGLDGLAGGISAIYFLMIGVISVLFHSSGLDMILTFVMLGSTLGFLVHNFYPATIFMGDSGSLFLGYIISIISLLGYKNVTFSSLIVPIFLLAIPIMDTFAAIIRRVLRHESIAMPDKCHLHHQLLRLNFSVKKAVLIIYMIDLLFAVASIIYVIKSRILGYIIYSLLIIIVIVFIYKTDIIRERKNKKPKRRK